jgi:hypothetical protein
MAGPAARTAATLALALIAGALAGCAAAPVQPWEKGVLARGEMRLDARRLEAGFADHVYTSKEAGMPGRGVGGGGCGCN